ncbi:MAG: hypothetical protein OXN25_04150 [Candidatus Poribacteria bacterium]|nr:hypothetical protein [Candidatus Poribacteria bacterium]
MDRNLSSLYRLGGLTGILSGFLMLASSIWFIFGLSSILSEKQFELIGRIGVFHGIGVLTLILLIPTLLASYGLLSSEAGTRSILGATFAVSWLIIELIAHCSQTAPLNELSKLANETSTASIGESLYTLWVEWGEALFMTGAFLCALLAICYGSALGAWGNSIGMYLFFISIIAFPVGVILNMDIQLHILTRGLAFLFLGGILLQAPAEEEQL